MRGGWTLFWLAWNAITLALNLCVGNARWAACSAFVVGALFVVMIAERR